MTSEEYKLYNLEDEIKKYTELNNTIVVDEDNNEFNKNKVRDDFVDILMKKLKFPELQAKDLEIGVFNATIDYANNYGIQLSWKSQILLDTLLIYLGVFILILKKIVTLVIKIYINAC